jgi:hypothetical protein
MMFDGEPFARMVILRRPSLLLLFPGKLGDHAGTAEREAERRKRRCFLRHHCVSSDL